jgi:uncharacterized SAM-dependent methyltransferase
LARLDTISAANSRLVLFLGSNIGNMEPVEAVKFLSSMRTNLRSTDRLLLGVDLVKDRAALALAYDDPLGVTAAFNRNLLVRMNRELGADFEVASFGHLAYWNEGESRVEMFLVSRREQAVRIPAAGISVSFNPGDRIWTESSYKYTPEGILAMSERAGFDQQRQWLDEDGRFALTLLRA